MRARCHHAQLIDVAAKKWKVTPDQVVGRIGHARPAGANVGDFKPLSVADIAREAAWYGGTDRGPRRDQCRSARARASARTFAMSRSTARPALGKVDVLRLRSVQDAGKAVYPEYRARANGTVAAAQGIGMGAQRGVHLQRAGGGCSIPASSTIACRVASGSCRSSTPRSSRCRTRCIPTACAAWARCRSSRRSRRVANAIYNATGVRIREQPMSPPRVLAAIDEKRATGSKQAA